MSALAAQIYPSPAPAHLLAPWLAHAQRSPQQTSIITSTQALDYASLLAQVQRCAAGLSVRGVDASAVIAFEATRTPSTLALILAILQRGAAYLPIDPALPVARRQQMLEDARPHLFVSAAQPREVGDVAALPSCSIDTLFETEPIALAPTRGELAYVLFTSGSTGRPKGVSMRTDALAHLIDWHVSHPRLSVAARTLQFAPLSFDVSFQEILSTLATGGTLVLPSDAERRDPWALIELIARERIKRIFLPYVALQALAEAALSARPDALASLRDVITAGEQLRITPALRKLFAALSDCVLHNHYGPTEAHVVTAHELHGDPATWPELPSIGCALPHVRIEIVDADLQSIAAQSEGELLLGGDCLAAGYIHRPELTAERFIQLHGERYYRTGDRVSANARSELTYLGRLDDQIKVAGFRIEPLEIESVLLRHAAVAEAVVVVEDVAGTKRLVAHIVPRDIRAQDSDLAPQLRRHCENLLADYLVPQAYVTHTLLPLTASGKIDRRALARNETRARIEWDTTQPLENQLLQLWKRLLELDTIDVRANLFDLGARSLTIVHALTEMRRHGHVLSVAQIYENPNLAAQARLLASPAGAESYGENPVEQQRGERQRAAFAGFARRHN